MTDFPPEAAEASAIRKASRRLVWFLVLLYLLNNIDRTNVGFAALTMNRNLGLSAQTFGMAVGIFYIGYLLFEIPSNLVFARTGARRSLARMAIGSGLVTVFTAFAQGPLTFYLARFLLGIAEAGYLVGIVLYLSYWFPASCRARLNALFMLALPLAFGISSAVAGSILSLDGLFGLAGWQWLFVLEGAPAVVAGLFALSYLSDHPQEAAWLTAAEQRSLAAAVARDGAGSPHASRTAWARLLALLLNPAVIVGGAIYFALNFGVISLTSWMPSEVRTFNVGFHAVGFLTMLAPFTAAVVMIGWSRWSDHRQERIVNTAVALLVGAAGWLVAALAVTPPLVMAGFIIAAIGVYAAYAMSFTITQTYVATQDRPIAIAIVGVIGNIGGVLVPMIVGALRTATGSFTAGFLVVSAVMAAVAGLTLVFRSAVETSDGLPAAVAID